MTPYDKDIRTAACAPLPWEQLEGCSVLVAGATGLIGSCLVDLLMEVARRGISVDVHAMGRSRDRILERFPSYAGNPRFHVVEQDVARPMAGDTPFHYIVHAASSASPQLYRNAPVEVMKANIDGVAHLMEYGLAHGMKRMLFISSGEVYGNHTDAPLKEADYGYVDGLDPRSCYPSSKRAAETLVACYVREYGADAVIARPCHTFGPHFTGSDQRAYAQFIRNIEAGEDIVLRSDGAQYRSWCYVVDCASALAHILFKGVAGQAYNIADEHCESSLRNLAGTLAALGGKALSVGQPDSTSNQRVIFDTALLKGLGWQASGTLEEKLKNTLASRPEKG